MHGNESNDPDVFVGVVWTSPVSATVDISGAVWYAMTGFNRSADWQIRLNDTVLTSGTVAAGDGSSSSSPFDLLDGTGGSSPLQSIAVTPVDKITLEFISLTSFAAFIGVDLTVSTSTTAVPTISDWGIASLVLVLLAGLTIKLRGAVPKRA